MIVFKVNTDSGGVLEIYNDSGEVVIACPFRGMPIGAFHVVNDGRIIVASEGADLSLLSPSDGDALATYTAPFKIRSMHVSGDESGVVLQLESGHLVWLDLPDLTLRHHYRWTIKAEGTDRSPRPLYGPEKEIDVEERSGLGLDDVIAIRPDKTVVSGHTSKRAVCTYLDLEAATIRQEVYDVVGEPDPMDRYFRWISPDGQYALRPAMHLLPKHRGSGLFTAIGKMFGKGTSSGERAHPDIEDGDRNYVGLVLELWRLDPCEKIREITVRMFEPSEMEAWIDDNFRKYVNTLRNTPSVSMGSVVEVDRKQYKKDRSLGRHIMAMDFLARRIYRLLWAPDGQSFYPWFWDYSLRSVGLDGSLSPLYRFQRFRAEDGIQPVESPIYHDQPTAITLDGVGDLVLTCADRGPASQYRVPGFNGNIPGPPVMVSMEEDGYRKWEPTSNEKSVAARFTGHRLKAGAESEANARAMLEQLAKNLRDNPEDVFTPVFSNSRKAMLLRFEIGGKTLTEETFIDAVVEHQWDVREALEDVMEAYLVHAEEVPDYLAILGEGTRIHAGAHLARGLIELRTNRFDLLARYFGTVDYENDGQLWELKLPQLFANRIGWRRRGAIECGLSWGVTTYIDVQYELFHLGLLKEVDKIMTAEELADLVFDIHIKLCHKAAEECDIEEERLDEIIKDRAISEMALLVKSGEGPKDFMAQAMAVVEARMDGYKPTLSGYGA